MSFDDLYDTTKSVQRSRIKMAVRRVVERENEQLIIYQLA